MWAIDLIKALIKRNYFGKLTLTFQKGKIVHVDKNESLKPPEGTT